MIGLIFLSGLFLGFAAYFKYENMKLEKELTATKNLNSEISILKSQLSSNEASIEATRVSLNALEEQNETLVQEVNCQELRKQTPTGGPFGFIGVDIIGYYEYSVKTLAELKENPSRPDDPENTVAEQKFWQENVDKAKPLYDNYIAQCGD